VQLSIKVWRPSVGPGGRLTSKSFTDDMTNVNGADAHRDPYTGTFHTTVIARPGRILTEHLSKRAPSMPLIAQSGCTLMPLRRCHSTINDVLLPASAP
jgi:hypothetical protein